MSRGRRIASAPSRRGLSHPAASYRGRNSPTGSSWRSGRTYPHVPGSRGCIARQALRILARTGHSDPLRPGRPRRGSLNGWTYQGGRRRRQGPHGPFSRIFLPSIDPTDARDGVLDQLSADDKKQLLATKIADVTHFRARAGRAARPRDRGGRAGAGGPAAAGGGARRRLLQPNGTAAERVSVQAARARRNGAHWAAASSPTSSACSPCRLPAVTDDDRRAILEKGLGLVVRGNGATVTTTVPVPPPGATALGEITLEEALEPLPESIVGALIDLVEDLPAVTPGGAGRDGEDPARPGRLQHRLRAGHGRAPLPVQRPRPARSSRARRRSTRCSPQRAALPGHSTASSSPDLGPGLRQGARDQKDTASSSACRSTSRSASTASATRSSACAGSTIDEARACRWPARSASATSSTSRRCGSTTGSRSATSSTRCRSRPGEQQRVAVSERVASARRARDRGARHRRAAARLDAPGRVDAGGVRVGLRGARARELDATRTRRARRAGASPAASAASGRSAPRGRHRRGRRRRQVQQQRQHAERARRRAPVHELRRASRCTRRVEQEAAAGGARSAPAIRLATETDRETVTTKVDHQPQQGARADRAVLGGAAAVRHDDRRRGRDARRASCRSTSCASCPRGSRSSSRETDLTDVDTRMELLRRYALLHRHADAIQPVAAEPAPRRTGRARGLRRQPARAGRPRRPGVRRALALADAARSCPSSGVWVRVLLRGRRSLGPVPLDGPLTELTPKEFGTRARSCSTRCARRRAERATSDDDGRDRRSPRRSTRARSSASRSRAPSGRSTTSSIPRRTRATCS